jgi:type 1 glutamine amidotransferase
MTKSLLFACLACALVLPLPAASPKAGAAKKPLRVCLVSGAETYKTDEDFATLADYLRREHGMEVEILRMSEDQKSIIGIERLLEADTAVFHVRRKTLNDDHLAILKRFFHSGKGFVGLRSTSHGWENWKDFDQTVLGVKYGGPGGNNFGNAIRLNFKPHPIWNGVEGLDTKRDLYRITEVSPDINVILEGETQNGKVPVGWTRTYHGARLFYLALGHREDIQRPAFHRTVANAIQWVTESETTTRRKR